MGKKVNKHIKSFESFEGHKRLASGREKSWIIEEEYPIELKAKKSWTGKSYIITTRPMEMRYETFFDLGPKYADVKVHPFQYDYKNGEAVFTADDLESIREWEEDNKDILKVNYSKAE